MLNIYFFQWPSNLGGADTRLKDLISCFSVQKKYKLFVIPNDSSRLYEKEFLHFCLKNNACPITWESLPDKLDGVAISFCNFRLFSEKWRIEKIKSMGLKFIWSNDMMWKGEGELEAIEKNLVDATIYTSEKHFKDTSNDIIKNKTKSFIVPNFFYLENYPFINRFLDSKDYFSIGKHSRADSMKFSINFPIFYESLNIKNPKFRIMGVDRNIRNLFKWFDFDKSKWDLLDCNQESLLEFLSSLDVYVYNANHKFTETQCRATIEALLTGLPVIAPNKPNFLDQIWSGKNGFLCDYFEDYNKAISKLQSSKNLREEMSHNARDLSINFWCNIDKQVAAWDKIFETIL